MKVESIIEELRTSVLSPELFLDTLTVRRMEDDCDESRPEYLYLSFPDCVDCKIWSDSGRFSSLRFRDWDGGGASLRTCIGLTLLMFILKSISGDSSKSNKVRKPRSRLNRSNMSKFFGEPQFIMMLGEQTHEFENRFAVSSILNTDLTFSIREEWGTGLRYKENQTLMNALILLAFAMQEDNTKPRP